MAHPDPTTLRWAADMVGLAAKIVSVQTLRGEEGPWLLRIEHDLVTHEAVLKCGRSVDWADAYACEAAALERAREHQLPAPRLLGVGVDRDIATLLMTRLTGSTKIPAATGPERLRAIGRAAAQIHSIRTDPAPELPLRERHTPWCDYAHWRRFAPVYRAADEDDRGRLLAEFVAAYPGWGPGAAHDMLMTVESSPLLDAADEAIRGARVEVDGNEPVFVHGDLWQGNTMWDTDRFVGLVDWEAAGAGHPGVDLGCLRWDAAVLFDPAAADEITAGWEEASGRAPDSVAYWDVVAGLNTPTDMSVIVPSLTQQGRGDLGGHELNRRRDAFLELALNRLRVRWTSS